MEYQTRRLIASDSMRHAGRELEPGDEFEATEVDAKYYLQHRRAREPEVKPEAARRGRPPKAVESLPQEPVGEASQDAAGEQQEP